MELSHTERRSVMSATRLLTSVAVLLAMTPWQADSTPGRIALHIFSRCFLFNRHCFVISLLRIIVISVSVCETVGLSAYLRNHNFQTSQIFMHMLPILPWLGNVLQRWLRCNTLYTSGFVDDVKFSYNKPYGGVTLQQQHLCIVAYVLTH